MSILVSRPSRYMNHEFLSCGAIFVDHPSFAGAFLFKSLEMWLEQVVLRLRQD